MKIRTVYTQETPRTFARGFSYVQVLQERGKNCVAHLQTTLDLRTNYDMTIIVDQFPAIEQWPDYRGVVYWDVPEDILHHLDNPEVQNTLHHVDGIMTHSAVIAQHLQRLAKRTVVIPTPLHDVALRQIAKQPGNDVIIGCFGPNTWSPWLDACQYALRDRLLGIVTDDDVWAKTIAPSLAIGGNQQYMLALRNCNAVLYEPHMDPFWARNALYYGIPVITSGKASDIGIDLPVISTSQDTWWKTWKQTDHNAMTRALASQHDQLVQQFGIRYIAHKWWRAMEKIVIRQSRLAA